MDGIGGIGCAPACDGGTCGALRITSTAHPPGMRLEGELDHGGVPAVTVALASLAHRAACGDGPFHVDLSGLDFIDVGGLRVLVGADLDAGDGDAGVIRVTSISPVVGRLLKLTGWETVPGWGRAAVADRVRPGIGGHRPPMVAADTDVVDGGG